VEDMAEQLGLMHDIRILTPEFEEYIHKIIDRMSMSYNL
jgi:hypothetical protein